MTYRIVDDALGGRVGEEIVLRFIDGTTPNGMTLWVSEMPEFDLGDRDLMFVKDNGISGCPLVGCTQGRLRVINGLVYTDSGREVLFDSDRIKFGRLHELDVVLSNGLAMIVSQALPPTEANTAPTRAVRIESVLELARTTSSPSAVVRDVSVSADASFMVGPQVSDADFERRVP